MTADNLEVVTETLLLWPQDVSTAKISILLDMQSAHMLSDKEGKPP